jgi:hypothetical protein
MEVHQRRLAFWMATGAVEVEAVAGAVGVGDESSEHHDVTAGCAVMGGGPPGWASDWKGPGVSSCMVAARYDEGRPDGATHGGDRDR